MQTYIIWLLTTYLVTAILFIMCFRLKAWLLQQGPVTQKMLRWPLTALFAIGLVSDLLLNYLFTPIFLDHPRKPLELVTQRMKRYKKTETGRRYRFAVWLCKQLNRYDKDHC